MGLDKANTPPMTLSRPSDTPTPSIETSEAPVEAHNSQASVAFKPLQ
ncbi:hypothetical protein A1F99_044240 [Pyrenophora tritici-repentis]|nr:hypothetical protein A1F99_044240 [Pyrenophora tritici-repentis]